MWFLKITPFSTSVITGIFCLMCTQHSTLALIGPCLNYGSFCVHAMFADPHDLHTAISQSAAAHHCNYALANSRADDLTSRNRHGHGNGQQASATSRKKMRKIKAFFAQSVREHRGLFRSTASKTTFLIALLQLAQPDGVVCDLSLMNHRHVVLDVSFPTIK